jgi:hypothetical protein
MRDHEIDTTDIGHGRRPGPLPRFAQGITDKARLAAGQPR